MSTTSQAVIAQLVETMRALAGSHPDSVLFTPRASFALVRFAVRLRHAE